MNVKLLTKDFFKKRGGEQLDELEDRTKVVSFIKLPKSVNDYMCDKGQTKHFKFSSVDTDIFADKSGSTGHFTFKFNQPKGMKAIDNFYDEPDKVRELALNQTFEFHPNNHKGKRTEKVFLFDGLKETFESILNQKIKNWNNYPVNGCFQICIGGDQLVYHVDLQEYAGIIFLTPDAPPSSGTSFYRSKYTKKTKVGSKGDEIVFKNGFLDCTEFELVDTVGNVYNRLVLFDAQMIHAASTYFGNNLENGRLFQMFFFDLE